MSRPCDASVSTAELYLPHSYRSNCPDTGATLVSSIILSHGFDRPSICCIIRKQSGCRVDERLDCPRALLADPTDHKTQLRSQIFVYSRSRMQARFCHLWHSIGTVSPSVLEVTGIEGSAGRNGEAIIRSRCSLSCKKSSTILSTRSELTSRSWLPQAIL